MDEGPDGEGMPRWVKVFGIIGILIVLIGLLVLLIGGGDHGPGRHAPLEGADTSVASAATGALADGPPSEWTAGVVIRQDVPATGTERGPP